MAKKFQNPEHKKAWDEFAHYCRIKGCLDTTGLAFVGVCVTCGKRCHIDWLQAGHFLSGRHNAIIFNEKFVNIQCTICNEVFHGKPKKYRKVMVERYGEEYVARWENKLKHQKIIHDGDINWVQRAARYKRKKEILLRKYGYKTFSELLREGK